MFGGNIYWAKLPLSIWGTIGGILSLRLLASAGPRRQKFLWWLAPFIVLNFVVLSSLLNPCFDEFIFYGQNSLRPISHFSWLPTSAKPSESLSELWLYSGMYLSAFNLLVAVKRRRTLREIALVLVINCSVLSVFGTIQHFAHTEIFFGLVSSPNPSFFASFIYHNHWAAYVLVTSSLGLGLVGYYLNNRNQRSFWHSPGFTLTLPLILAAISIPLSGSRSGTLAMLGLATVSAGYFFFYLIRRFRHNSRAQFGATAGLLLVGFLSIGSIYYLAKPVIKQRTAETVQQLKKEKHYAFIAAEKIFYAESRFRLYEDTIEMIGDKPIWGWGFGSYGYVFHRYNSQSAPATRWPTIFEDAHSDWLEALAEIGIVGTTLVVGMALGPLLTVRRFVFSGPFPGFLFTGATLLALYAMIEFPFANPAITLSFWTVLFMGLRYAGLELANASSVSRESNHSERRSS